MNDPRGTWAIIGDTTQCVSTGAGAGDHRAVDRAVNRAVHIVGGNCW